MRPSMLAEEQVRSESRTVPDWTVTEGEGAREIVREYRFKDFLSAIAFVNGVAEAAEAMDHHPDIDIRYSKVKLALTTHSAGGLTANDFDLARQADRLFESKQ